MVFTFFIIFTEMEPKREHQNAEWVEMFKCKVKTKWLLNKIDNECSFDYSSNSLAN